MCMNVCVYICIYIDRSLHTNINTRRSQQGNRAAERTNSGGGAAGQGRDMKAISAKVGGALNFLADSVTTLKDNVLAVCSA